MNKWLGEVERIITSATADMTEQQLLWHPEGKWSTAQILEHLSLAFGGTARAFEKLLAAGKPSASVPNFKQRARVFAVTTLGYFPEGRQSPKQVMPTGALGGLESVDKIKAELVRLIAAQERVQEQFGNVRLADHPILGPLTTWQWLRFHYVHTRHHMKQITRLRRDMATAHADTA